MEKIIPKFGQDIIQIDSYQHNGENYLITIIPLKLMLSGLEDINNTTQTHLLTLCLIFKEESFIAAVDKIQLFTHNFAVKLGLNLLGISLVLCLGTYLAFKMTHRIIRPLRTINQKMREVINEGMKRDLVTIENSCLEISKLYQVFQQLIKTKKFENNDFEDKEDSLAVIDLAEACNMFTNNKDPKIPPNYKNAGICYNNIGNIQYKQGKYILAAENFFMAITQARECLKIVENETLCKLELEMDRQPSRLRRPIKQKELKQALLKDSDHRQYTKVLANRSYLYAMSLYKHLRYQKDKQDNQLKKKNKEFDQEQATRQESKQSQHLRWL